MPQESEPIPVGMLQITIRFGKKGSDDFSYEVRADKDIGMDPPHAEFSAAYTGCSPTRRKLLQEVLVKIATSYCDVKPHITVKGHRIVPDA